MEGHPARQRHTFQNGYASSPVTFATAVLANPDRDGQHDASLTGQGTTNVVAPAAATRLVVQLPQNVPTEWR